ncbi:MAG: hypothetical protein HHJ12_00935 [Glaciimonas sp.]|nr:hypothetical protein [Glaciimonas sp.]
MHDIFPRLALCFECVYKKIAAIIRIGMPFADRCEFIRTSSRGTVKSVNKFAPTSLLSQREKGLILNRVSTNYELRCQPGEQL